MSRWFEPLERRALLAAAAGNVELAWPTFGGNPAHTGAVAGTTAGLAATPAWATDSVIARGNEVATGDGKVFVSGTPSYGSIAVNLQLRALDAETGKVLWTRTFADGATLGAPTFYNDRVYVQRGDHSSSTGSQLFALNADTGAVVWSAPFTAQWEHYTAPAVDSTGIWINGGYYGGMYGFDFTGKQLVYNTSLTQIDRWSPSLKDGYVYTYAGQYFNKYNAATNALVWSHNVQSGMYWETPGGYGRLSALDGTTGYLVAGQSLRAIDLTSGVQKWRVSVPAEGTPAVKDGTVYVNTSAGAVYAFDASDGTLERTYSALYGQFTGQPIVTEDSLITASADNTYVFDLDGTLRQTLTVGGSVALGSGYLYVSSAYAGLHAFQFGGGLRGHVFNDANVNGTKDAGETAYTDADAKAYVDLDNNYQFTAGEPVAALDDAGNYAFHSLPAGYYVVSLLLPTGAVKTTGLSFGPAYAGQTNAVQDMGVIDTSYVSGYAFNDADSDGVKDAGEAVIAGRIVYDDANLNDRRDAGEASATTNANGYYKFGLSGGYHRIAQELPAAAMQTGRSSVTNGVASTTSEFATTGWVYVTTGYATPATSYDFGSTSSGRVNFSAYVDNNANGKYDTGDTIETSANYVWADRNDNASLDPGEQSLQAASGGFTLPVGTYTLRIYPKATTLTPTATKVVVTAGGVVTVPFALVPTNARTYGYAYNDYDADGVYDNGEPVLFNRTIYIDANNNGVLDTGETSAVTGSAGMFTFQLPAGTYRLRQVVPAGFRHTGQNLSGPSAGSTFAADGLLRVPADNNGFVYFGSRALAVASGSAWLDGNGNGVKDATESNTTAGGFVYADANANGVYDAAVDIKSTTATDGTWSMLLAPGNYVIRQSLESGWEQTYGGYLGNSTLTVGPIFQSASGIAFGRRQKAVVAGASVSGSVYNDANKNATRDTTEAGLANQTVYIDLDNDKILDADELRTTTDASGAFAFANVPNTGSATRLRVIVSAGVTQTSPVNGNGYGLTLGIGATNTAKTFGLYSAPVVTTGTLSGTAFDDTNKNGVLDAGEAKTAGKTVFLDLDGDNVLDSNERKTTTATDGRWAFSGLVAGTYRVRRVFPSGYTLSTTPIDVSLAAGQVVSGLLIGSKSGTTTPTNTASVSGFAFDDKNKNGLYDAGDAVAAGKTIWLDLDDDNVKDSGETSVVSASDGSFSFKNLVAGTYHVRRLFPSGYLESTPARYITLTTGQAAAGVGIGSRAK